MYSNTQNALKKLVIQLNKQLICSYTLYYNYYTVLKLMEIIIAETKVTVEVLEVVSLELEEVEVEEQREHQEFVFREALPFSYWHLDPRLE